MTQKILNINKVNFYLKTPTCFPSAAKVTLKNGKLVTMSELKIGDKVQTGNKEIKFSLVT